MCPRTGQNVTDPSLTLSVPTETTSASQGAVQRLCLSFLRSLMCPKARAEIPNPMMKIGAYSSLRFPSHGNRI